MKQSELVFNLISIPVDFVMVIIAGITAFYLRFELVGLRPIIYDLPVLDFVQILLLIAPIAILLLALAGLYNLKGTRRFSAELTRIVLAISSGLLVVVVLFFFNQTVFPSRLIILIAWGLAIMLVSLGRVILRLVQIQMLKKGVGLHRLVVIDGGARSGESIIDEIKRRPELGYNIVATINFSNAEDLFPRLEQIRKESGIDEILQSNSELSAKVNNQLLIFSRDYGILFNFVPDIFETSRTNVAVETISGIPVIVLKGTPLEGWGRVLKRSVDIAVSFFSLIILSPIMIVAALAIKLSSKGPVFFHQARAAGLGSFECYKFRSMYYEMSEGTVEGDKLRAEIEKQNARLGPFVKIKNDPRVTRVGKILRRTKIDELPQLWHILRGQMSLVGPRVHMVKEVEKFQNEYKKIFTIKPGATGITQITQAGNPELSFEEEIRLDTFYIENWSLWLDIYIIFKTVLILFGKRQKVDY
ncbi:MAG: sugar transferase [Candidatus Doudnabacteria bacterium]|nr:sugar transferase [Candidatus Doudnabacteria bacterium]